MKTTILFAALLALACTAQAQDWSPLRLGERYHYEQPLPQPLYSSFNDTLVSTIYTLFADSVYVENGDSVYVLNQYYRDTTPTPTWTDTLVRTPVWMGEQLRQQAGGVYEFVHTGQSFFLNTQAHLSDTWLWDTTQLITASVVAIGDTMLFGIVDSIKTIALSNGDTLRLCKRLGILADPAQADMRLIGLETMGVGDTLPSCTAWMNFPVDYTFKTRQQSNSMAGEDFHFKQWRILSRSETATEIEYSIDEYTWSSYYTFWGIRDTSSNRDTIAWTEPRYAEDAEDFCSTYTGYWTLNGFITMGMYYTVYRTQAGDRVNRGVGVIDPLNLPSEPQQLEVSDCSSSYYGCAVSYYHPSLFLRQRQVSWIDIWERYEVLGYAFQGDTIGEIWSEEDLFLLKTAEPQAQHHEAATWRFYPNPAHDFIAIECADLSATSDFLTIFNAQGQCVFRQALAAATRQEFDLSALPAGFYVVEMGKERYKLLLN